MGNAGISRLMCWVAESKNGGVSSPCDVNLIIIRRAVARIWLTYLLQENKHEYETGEKLPRRWHDRQGYPPEPGLLR
jgi:hypothetical protein